MEAARMAQGLGYHRAMSNGDQQYEDTCHRTFWVVYQMEKQMCFQHHKGSVGNYEHISPASCLCLRISRVNVYLHQY